LFERGVVLVCSFKLRDSACFYNAPVKVAASWQRTLLLLIGLLASTALAFVALEATVRALKLAPPLVNQYRDFVADPHLPFKPKPSSVLSGRSQTDEFHFVHRHNSLGFRDVEHARGKGEGVFRILGLGDSFTYGVGADFEQTYLHRLEQMLNARSGNHPRIEIVKAGLPRYYPQLERVLLDKYGRDFSPDLIVVGFVPNDIIDTYFGIEAVTVDGSGHLRTREAAELGALGTLAYRKSHVFRIVLKRYVDYQVSTKFRPQWTEIFKDDGYHEKDWRAVEAEYQRIADIAHEINARVLLVHIPQMGPWNEMHRYPSKRLGRWAKKNHVDFVDTLSHMTAASGSERLYYELDGHCTPEGYEVIAQAIFNYVTEHGLVP
jgi:lysophospholipase L1-like esterase